MFRSTYDVTPYNTYESDADLSHLIGNISNAKSEFVFTIFTSGPTGAPGIAYIHTDAPKTYHPSPKTAQQLQQLGQINVNSNSHYMAQNPFLVNQETPAPSTAHRLLKNYLLVPDLNFFFLQQHFPWNPSPDCWQREEKYQSGELQSFVVTLPALDHC